MLLTFHHLYAKVYFVQLPGGDPYAHLQCCAREYISHNPTHQLPAKGYCVSRTDIESVWDTQYPTREGCCVLQFCN